MKINSKLKNLRGSIFIDKSMYDWNFVQSILDTVPGYVPGSINKGFSQPNWELVSPDNNYVLMLLSQKIDYTLKDNDEITSEMFDEFIEKCKNIFDKIMEVSKLDANRIAIAPTYVYEEDESEPNLFINKVFKLDSYKNTKVYNIDFSQVFRVIEKINDDSIKINYCSKFYEMINKVKMMGLDINTNAEEKYSFSIDAVNDFFNNANSFCLGYKSFYFSD